MGPNPIAYLALVAFIPAAVIVFARLPRAAAAACVVLAGSLLLPERAVFDLPGLPPLDKEYITYLAVLIGALVHRLPAVISARPGLGPEAIIGLLVMANVATAVSNQDALFNDGVLDPGVPAWEVIARIGDDILRFGIPFFVGRAMFRSKEDLRVLMTMLGLAGMAYTALIAFEIAMSIPFGTFHLNSWIYGLSTVPTWRWGMIQPVVFMDHGLSIATFMCASTLAATGFAKAGVNPFPLGSKKAVGILYFGLLLCKNVAGVVYGTVLVLALAILRPRGAATVALVLGIFVLAYPSLRMAGLFPADQIIELVYDWDPLRARSLEGRFEEEEHVVGGVGEKVWLGWGTYSRIPGLLDREGRGSGSAGLDGYWIIRFGTHGIIGLELRLALLLVPIGIAWRRQKLLGSLPDRALVVALMAIVAMRGVDLLPNGWWNCLPAFLAGSLYGVTQSIKSVRSWQPRAARRVHSAPEGSLGRDLLTTGGRA